MRPQRLFLLIFPRSSSAPSSYCLFLFAQILSFLLYILFPFSLNIDSLGDPVALRRRRTRRQSVRRCAEDPQSVVRRTKDQRRRGPQAHSDSGVAAPRCPFKSHQLIGCRLGQSTFHFSLNLLRPFFPFSRKKQSTALPEFTSISRVAHSAEDKTLHSIKI